MVFNGVNTYSGNTAISNGTISINDFSQLGTATTPIALGNSTGTLASGALLVGIADQVTTRGLTINNGGGSINYTGALTINGPIAGSTGSTGGLVKAGAGVLTTASIRIGGTLNIPTGTLVTKPDGTDAASNHVGALALAGGVGGWTSQLDLNNNGLIVDYTGAANSPLATVADQLKSGYALGTWAGSGIASGSAAAVALNPTIHKTALGYAEASALGISTFAGQSVDDDAIVVRYTLQGDANLDGTVNALDFNAVASNFGSAAPWNGGDFNYDGTVNAQDFTAIGQNFGLTVSPAPALGALVPEPVSATTFAAICMASFRRRRRSGCRS
jgi:autotransporter-associated beta strand protein